MALTPGARLGPYEIVSAIGAGGMGEVYRARDTRLDRTVAVKILPVTLAADAQFRDRFDREARAISQLSHPHICTLHDVGRLRVSEASAAPGDEIDFLVMEMLEGETLASRLEKGALPPDLAFKTALEILSALDAAHRSGIVHRDLKPANVMLTRGGAKLLDFGLAKASGPAVMPSGLSMAPTTPPATMTAAGTILGTFQYMAPEQIEGMEADARTDLFALGCVLYEMLTGRKAFEGKTRASLLGAILKDDPPPISDLQPVAPRSVDRIVSTCLAKDPDDRWQTARDLMRELQLAAAAPSVAAVPARTHTPPPRVRRLALAATVAATAVGAAAVSGLTVWVVARSRQEPRAVARLQVAAPAMVPIAIDPISADLALSTDGRRLAYVAGVGPQAQLFVRALDEPEAKPLPGLTGVRGPFFAPDGEWVGFFQAGDLKKVSFHGGPSVSVCVGCGNGNRGATWGSDGTIVFAPTGGAQGLMRVPAAGGEPVRLTKVDVKAGESAHMWPAFLPNSRALLFTVGSAGGIESASIVARDLNTGTQNTVVRGGSQAQYVVTGHLVYAFAGTLRAVRFDAAQLAALGNPVPVVERVLTKFSGSADFSVSRDGSLAYVAGDMQSIGQRLAWLDRQGHEETIPAPPRNYLYLRLSPDGQRVALDVRDQQNDIWIWDLSRSVLTRLTTDPGVDQSPIWTRDGRRIVFASNRDGALNLYWQAADGTGSAERLTTSTHIQVPWAFSQDAKKLVLLDTDPKTASDIGIMSIDGDRMVKPLVHTSFLENHAEISPDGHWIAYDSNESGHTEVHVRPFPNVDAGHWQVSADGGARPLWAPSGRELFYLDSANRILAVPVRTDSSFGVGQAAVAAEGAGPFGGSAALGRGYDVSPDGRRFLVIRSATRSNDQSTPPQVNIVLNWTEELKRLVPAQR